MLSPNDYKAFLRADYSLPELGFAFVRLKIVSWLWTRLKYPLRRRGARACIDYTVDIAGARFIEIGEDTWIQRHTWLTVPLIDMRRTEDRAYLSIGKRVQIGRNCFIGASNRVILSDDVLLGPHVTIVDHSHRYADPAQPVKEQGITQEGSITVGAGAWIGAGAIILGQRGLSIGENAVVAAHAVLTKDLPARCLAVGHPARITEIHNK
ncbi:MAG: DapH/DapD/GlmU-related protein [Terrimicrobiaceae bacterium]